MVARSPSEEELRSLLAPLVPSGVQWFPGHMAKTKRAIVERLRLVNVVVEVIDARMPRSSRHPELSALARKKSRIVALTKVDLAEAEATQEWLRFLRLDGTNALPVDANRGTGVGALLSAIRRAERSATVLVVGIPNSGKSSLINRACGRAGARVGALAGVTRSPQWLRVGPNVQFLDTPGLLWPKIEDLLQGLKLAWAGSVGENAFDVSEVGTALALWLRLIRPELLEVRYGIECESELAGPGEIVTRIGAKRGCLLPGGVIDYEQAARALLQDLRTGRLGRITFDTPPTTHAGPSD